MNSNAKVANSSAGRRGRPSVEFLPCRGGASFALKLILEDESAQGRLEAESHTQGKLSISGGAATPAWPKEKLA